MQGLTLRIRNNLVWASVMAGKTLGKSSGRVNKGKQVVRTQFIQS